MFDNKVHNWCCFSDVEQKFPDMWTDKKQAAKAKDYCKRQYEKIEQVIPVIANLSKRPDISDELKEALSIALDCMGETEGIYQDYGRAVGRPQEE